MLYFTAQYDIRMSVITFIRRGHCPAQPPSHMTMTTDPDLKGKKAFYILHVNTPCHYLPQGFNIVQQWRGLLLEQLVWD